MQFCCTSRPGGAICAGYSSLFSAICINRVMGLTIIRRNQRCSATAKRIIPSHPERCTQSSRIMLLSRLSRYRNCFSVGSRTDSGCSRLSAPITAANQRLHDPISYWCSIPPAAATSTPKPHRPGSSLHTTSKGNICTRCYPDAFRPCH